MTKVFRNESTPESRKFWKQAEDNAEKVQSWPAWKRGGINVADVRSEPREYEPPKLEMNMQLIQSYIDMMLDLETQRAIYEEVGYELSQDLELEYAEKLEIIWNKMKESERNYVEDYLKNEP